MNIAGGRDRVMSNVFGVLGWNGNCQVEVFPYLGDDKSISDHLEVGVHNILSNRSTRRFALRARLLRVQSTPLDRQ